MIRLERNSERYARAAGKVASLSPNVDRLGGGVYRVQGSRGDTYFVREVLPGLFYCECRFGRKPSLCYHCVAVDLERLHNEVRSDELGIMVRELTTKERMGMQLEAAWIRRQLEMHRVSCARCAAGDECRAVIKQRKNLAGLQRDSADRIDESKHGQISREQKG